MHVHGYLFCQKCFWPTFPGVAVFDNLHINIKQRKTQSPSHKTRAWRLDKTRVLLQQTITKWSLLEAVLIFLNVCAFRIEMLAEYLSGFLVAVYLCGVEWTKVSSTGQVYSARSGIRKRELGELGGGGVQTSHLAMTCPILIVSVSTFSVCLYNFQSKYDCDHIVGLFKWGDGKKRIYVLAWSSCYHFCSRQLALLATEHVSRLYSFFSTVSKSEPATVHVWNSNKCMQNTMESYWHSPKGKTSIQFLSENRIALQKHRRNGSIQFLSENGISL